MDATVIVGIDVSKDRLDVAVRPGGIAFAVSRDGEGIASLVEQLNRFALKAVAVEATGGFEKVVAAGLAGAGLPVVVVNPAQVRAFAHALGKRAKTDPIDAAVIAHFVEATAPVIRPLTPAGHWGGRPEEAMERNDEHHQPNCQPDGRTVEAHGQQGQCGKQRNGGGGPEAGAG
jgi:hypothetical protein